MSKISIQLSKEYKSFQPETFFLEGDLIILTGVNGSGKSQLLDIIRKVTYADTKNNNQQTKIDSVTKKDNVEIPESRVMYKSFKDLINIPQIQSVNQKQINFDLAWNWLVSGFQPSNTIGYTKCAATLESNLKTKEYVFGGNNENEKSRFKKSFSDDFVLFPDDTFTKSVYSLFQDYLYKVSINQRIEKGSTHLQRQIIPKNKPWEELNKLFKNLKFDYEFEEPFESGTYDLIDQPLLKSTLDSNLIIDTDKLSDGEKAIFSLAISVIEFGSKDLPFDILLLDEYDATLNPSLIESFHYVLQKYFIKNKVQVILTSHSATTISLAQDNTEVYEVFKSNIKNNGRVLKVDKTDYSELKVANKDFYNKIKQQNKRVKELENEKSVLENKNEKLLSSKIQIFCEGTTDFIYIKLALKYFSSLNPKPTFVEKIKTQYFQSSNKLYFDNKVGDTEVLALIKYANKLNTNNKFIGIFDSDNSKLELNNIPNTFKIHTPLNRSNKNQNEISIEYLFEEIDNKIELEIEGVKRRLFLGIEFDNKGRHPEGYKVKSIDKCEKCIIFENVDSNKFNDQVNNYALSKTNFAEAIKNKKITISDKSWENFRPIFETLEKILDT